MPYRVIAFALQPPKPEPRTLALRGRIQTLSLDSAVTMEIRYWERAHAIVQGARFWPGLAATVIGCFVSPWLLRAALGDVWWGWPAAIGIGATVGALVGCGWRLGTTPLAFATERRLIGTYEHALKIGSGVAGASHAVPVAVPTLRTEPGADSAVPAPSRKPTTLTRGGAAEPGRYAD